MIPGLKTNADQDGDNRTLTFFLIYDKINRLYGAGKSWLDTMNNAEVYRTPKSALEGVKRLRKGGLTYVGSPPGKGARQVKCDPVAVMHSVSVKTLPTYTYEELLQLIRDERKDS